ncbi:hypothetical protein GCM10011504_22560 [Siccirubricoccus deserti]|uniref:Uncharacterized protein n=1 Tax=Siccirubricoccus deserti TaxID=2013562 RepID=A0A9X0UDH3_9PROT|nr:hypothetical protein [Siccirubricoccus deserti]MBC4015671.1 hypothetical protein [Siccirubricoccus deserti]GGC43583.1 hypothetical protein GCM10011504_22560 [Siccirubricoccus deserti]
MARIPCLILAPLLLSGCQMDSRQQILASTNSQVAQRAISTRAFETSDQAKVFQAVIASLQDLGFVVDRADNVLGSVSATRFGAQLVRLTVSVRPGSGSRTIVRASGQLNQHELSDPAPFQRFFEALSQALFLDANSVE